MERESGHGEFSVEQTAKRFMNLKDRFIKEGKNENIRTRENAEKILDEVIEIAVEALIESKGHPHVMESLELEFIAPLLREMDPYHHGPINQVSNKIATKVTQKLLQKK